MQIFLIDLEKIKLSRIILTLRTDEEENWRKLKKDIVAALLRSLWTRAAEEKNNLRHSKELMICKINTMNFFLQVSPRFSFTDDHSELIQTNKELLRNERIFTELCLLKGAKIVISWTFYLIYIHFWECLAFLTV